MRIQNKFDTKERWAENNPVLKAGELGFDDLGRAKVGNGVTPWNNLNYINDINRLSAVTDTQNTTNTFVIGADINNRVYYFTIAKDTKLEFQTVNDNLFFIEKRIYIENIGENEIELSIENAEWANDSIGTDWGKPGMHLYLQATWIGGRIIVEVIDNDQLADNQL